MFGSAQIRIVFGTALLAAAMTAAPGPRPAEAAKVLATPATMGDQLFFLYDARTDRVPVLAVSNLAPATLKIETVFYSQDLTKRLSSRTDTLAGFGNIIMDPSTDPAVRGSAGLAVVTPVNDQGEPIVPPSMADDASTPSLSGSFTLANTKLRAGFGQSPFGRMAVDRRGERATALAVVDGTNVWYQRFAPDALFAPIYFDPKTLSPESQDGNRVILVSFKDVYYASTFRIQPRPFELTALFSNAKGTPVGGFISVPVSGVRFDTLGGIAGSTPLQGSGKLMFFQEDPLEVDSNLFGLMSQAVGTYAVGQRISGTFLEDRDTKKYVFLATVYGGANFGGLDGADAICQQNAREAGLGGRYKAWLSDSTASPATRFNRAEVPYVLPDGTVIAESWNDLVDGEVRRWIWLNAAGGRPGQTFVYTNTKSDGTAYAKSPLLACDDWKDASDDAKVIVMGNSWHTRDWSMTSERATCDGEQEVRRNGMALYCFEQ